MDLSWTHGWSGLAVFYGSVQAPMVAGLIRGHAAVRSYFTAPLLSLPLCLVAAVGSAASAPLLTGMGLSSHGVVALAVTTAVSTLVGYTGGRIAARERGESGPHQRGAVIGDPPRPAKPQAGREAQITLGGAVIPIADESKHFKLIGTTGTGKSTAIQSILSTVLGRGDRAVIADPDGGYLRRFYDPSRGDVVLNPFDQRSLKWDLFGEIKTDYDVDQLARSLIPDHEGGDRSWRGYARTFFSAVTRQAHGAGINDLGELYRLLVVADSKELRPLVEGTPAQPFLDEHNSRMFDSIRSVTSSAVGALDYIANQKSDKFSIRDWVSEDSPGVLFIPYKAAQIAALRSTISAWMRLAIFEAMNQEEQLGVDTPGIALPGQKTERSVRRLWFVIDELDALGPIDGLKDALARLRKFGGRCVLGFQSIAQVSTTYGPGDAHTIVENCANTLILRCSASEGGGTARFASQLIGDREVTRTTVSRSRRYNEMFGSVSHSEHVAVEPAVLPSQIEQLPDLSGYLKQASAPQWHRVRMESVQRWQQQRVKPAVPSQVPKPRAVSREGDSRE